MTDYKSDVTLLFDPMKLGNIKFANRFVCSATYEALAGENGEVTRELIERYERLANGGVGLCITGMMYFHGTGRGYRYQTGIHNDRMLPGLTKLTEAVHKSGGKIAFQLAHAGRQTTKEMIGRRPLAPSSQGRDPMYFIKPAEMTEEQIETIIHSATWAALRAVKAGADGIQLHAAHGYLYNQFLSPYFNTRVDGWGKNAEKRFELLKQTYTRIREAVPKGFPVFIKLNAHDYIERQGMVPTLAAKYAGWLAQMGVDAVEVSGGTTNYSYMNICRGDVPVAELVKSLPWWKKPFGWLMIKRLKGNYDLEEGYHLEAAKIIKPMLHSTPLILVGGIRSVSFMNKLLANNHADFIAMSRPFLREPSLVNKIKEGRIGGVSCVSCNRCLAAIPAELPIRCYNEKIS